MKYSHTGIIQWDQPYQTMKVMTNQGVEVPFAFGIPGEKIKLRLIKEGRQYRITDWKIKYYSPERIPSPCRHFPRCSGCDWLHVPYSLQVRWKRNFLRSLLERHQLQCHHPLEFTSSFFPFGTRHKAVYPVQKRGTEILCGLYQRGTHEIIPLDDCPMVPMEINAFRKLIIDWFRTAGVPVYDEHTRTGWLRYLQFQKSYSKNKILITIIVNYKDLSMAHSLAQFLKRHTSMPYAGLHMMVNSVPGNTIISQELIPIQGDAIIYEHILSHRLPVAPATFYQANPYLAGTMFLKILQWVMMMGLPHFLDLFSGIGAIGQILAEENRSGIGLESNPSSVRLGNAHLRQHAITHFSLHQTDLYAPSVTGEILRIMEENQLPIKQTILIADPPRKGLGKPLLELIKRALFPAIIYVSCNPERFGKEAAELVHYGYRLHRLAGFDLFPGTRHLEAVGLFLLPEL